MGTQKNRLNETVLLSTNNTCLIWYGKNNNFTLKTFAYWTYGIHPKHKFFLFFLNMEFTIIMPWDFVWKLAFDGNTLTLYALMDSSFWFDTINLGWSIVYIKGSQVKISKYNCISFTETCDI